MMHTHPRQLLFAEGGTYVIRHRLAASTCVAELPATKEIGFTDVLLNSFSVFILHPLLDVYGSIDNHLILCGGHSNGSLFMS